MESQEFNLCPRFQKTFAFLGRKWNGLIIEVLLQNGNQRFAELHKKIPGISERVLASRLKDLECDQIIEKHNCQGNNSQYPEYALTAKGQDLQTIIDAIHEWSEKWIEL